MHRTVSAFFALIVVISSCKKEDEKLISTQTYRNVVYVVESNQQDLQVTFSRGIYSPSMKGNVDNDTTFGTTGFFQFPASVLTGVEMQLYAISYTGGNFKLKIKDETGQILSNIDEPSFDPANQLHPDRWYARLRLLP